MALCHYCASALTRRTDNSLLLPPKYAYAVRCTPQYSSSGEAVLLFWGVWQLREILSDVRYNAPVVGKEKLLYFIVTFTVR